MQQRDRNCYLATLIWILGTFGAALGQLFEWALCKKNLSDFLSVFDNFKWPGVCWSKYATDLLCIQMLSDEKFIKFTLI